MQSNVVFNKSKKRPAKKVDKKEQDRLARRKMLKEVFEDTLLYCQNVAGKTRVVTHKVSDWENTMQLPSLLHTGVQVINDDCMEVAKQFVKTNGRTCMLNMANAVNRGGGVVNGSMAQEEELCRRSNLWYGLRPSYYPMLDNEFIYSKNVKFFKDRQYKLMPEFKCDILTIAAPCLIHYPKGKFPKGYSQTVENKIRIMLTYPSLFGVKNLVLSAFGCGAFRNNPIFMSREFKKIMKEGLPYDSIYFAILDDKNSQANGISNFNAFKNTFRKFENISHV